MNYYIDLFSPNTYDTFSRSDRTVSGVRKQQEPHTRRIKAGDRLIAYVTKVGRWVGVLEVESDAYEDDSPRFEAANDPFVIRFRVKPLIWLPIEQGVPIKEKVIWDALSFTKGASPESATGWTGVLRRSLNRLTAEDGRHLETVLGRQVEGQGESYPLDEDQFRRLIARPVRREDKTVSVTVPVDEDETPESEEASVPIRESTKMQALLASTGEKMGFKIWVPKHDRGAVTGEWSPATGSLLSMLPLNYDETTLQTIEQIDVLWLKGRSIVRAFEVEHTTAIYSGLLRMADLLALQPNMNIKLHIVAPDARKQKVFDEIRRPVFSLLERAPLSECCTFISYDGLRELAQEKHLEHLSDSVLEAYEEEAE
jgi:hypothetical protein